MAAHCGLCVVVCTLYMDRCMGVGFSTGSKSSEPIKMCAHVPCSLSSCFPVLQLYNTMEQDRRLGEVIALLLPLLFRSFMVPRVGNWRTLCYWKTNTASIPHSIPNYRLKKVKGPPSRQNRLRKSRKNTRSQGVGRGTSGHKGQGGE